MSGLSEQRFAEIEAREAAAFRGPWFVVTVRDADDCGDTVVGVATADDTFIFSTDASEPHSEISIEDAAFTAYAREDVPALVGEVKRLKALWSDVAKIARSRTAEAKGRAQYGKELKARVAELEAVAERLLAENEGHVKHAASLLVQLKAAEALGVKLANELAEVKAGTDPRLRCLIVKPSPTADLYVGWSNVVEAPAGMWTRAEALAYGFPPSRLDRADKNGSSDLSCGDGHWGDWGFIAEQRGTLRRDRLAEYARLWLDDNQDAAFGLLEPFEGETEVRR